MNTHTLIAEINTTTGNLDTTNGTYDIYKDVPAGGTVLDGTFVGTTHELPPGAVQLDHEPASADYTTVYQLSVDAPENTAQNVEELALELGVSQKDVIDAAHGLGWEDADVWAGDNLTEEAADAVVRTMQP